MLYTYGKAGSGLYFTIETADGGSGSTDFTVHVLEGSMNLNAVYWGDHDQKANEGSFFNNLGQPWNPKSDPSLNMNGANTVWGNDGSSTTAKEVWDGGIKLSDPGLGHGTDTYLTAGSDFHFSAAVNMSDIVDLGVRATSTSTAEGSIKWVDEHGTEPAPTPHAGDLLFQENFDSYAKQADHGSWYETNLGVGSLQNDNLYHGWANEQGTGAYGEIVQGQGILNSIESSSGGWWLDTQNSPGGINISNWFHDPTGGAFKFEFDIGIHDFGTGPMQETASDAKLEVKVDGQLVKTITYADLAATPEQMVHQSFVVNNVGNGGAAGNHTINFHDVTPSTGNFVGFALDTIAIHDWVV
jgi:hypothetical protein